MTEHDLTTLVREHATHEEPPFPGPAAVIEEGRRTVRRHRTLLGVGAVAVLAVATAVALPLATSSPDPDRPNGIDAAVQEALSSYDAAAMPELIDDVVRPAFSRTVPDIGEGEFSASDGQDQRLPPKHYDKASRMSINYGGDGEHQLSVDLSHARSEAEGDAQAYCDSGLDEGYYLECTVEPQADGSIAIAKLWAFRSDRSGPMDHGVVVNEARLDRIDPDRLWFERNVKVVKSETFLTYVGETVKAPDRTTAEQLLQVPVDDLIEIATDPRLVIPHPPADPESGCDQWILPGSGVICEQAP